MCNFSVVEFTNAKNIINTVEPRYNEVLGTMKITLLYQVSHYIRVKKQRNIKSWDQQNYLVIRGFCYISDLFITRFHCITVSQFFNARVFKVQETFCCWNKLRWYYKTYPFILICFILPGPVWLPWAVHYIWLSLLSQQHRNMPRQRYSGYKRDCQFLDAFPPLHWICMDHAAKPHRVFQRPL